MQVACSTKSARSYSRQKRNWQSRPRSGCCLSCCSSATHSHMIAVYNSTTAKKFSCAGTSTEGERERDCLSRSFPTTRNQLVCERIYVFSGSHFFNKLTYNRQISSKLVLLHGIIIILGSMINPLHSIKCCSRA
jgi:hypothetical protein